MPIYTDPNPELIDETYIDETVRMKVYDSKLKRMSVSMNVIEVCGYIAQALSEPKANEKNFSFYRFTHLKDKNKTEIFEGDIVKCQNKIGMVSFVPSNCITCSCWAIMIRDMPALGESIGLEHAHYDQIEVIGHKRTHPNLLKLETNKK